MYDHPSSVIAYIFRRAAARAVAAPRQIRPAPRVNSFQSSIPSLSRTFHQSRIWRAEEEKKKDAVSESSGTTSEPLGQSEHQSQTVSESASESGNTTQSSTSSGQDALSESSGTTSEPVGQSEHQSQSFTEQASDIAQKAQSTVSDAASKAAETAKEYIPSQQQAQETASNVSEQAQETASKAAEQTQSAASSMARAARNTTASAGDAFERNNPFTQGATPPSKILYVGNLFFEVTAPQLEAEFAKHGEVVNSRVVTDNRGLSKGFGYIELADQTAANAALEALNQKVFQGRRMSVQFHKRRNPNESRDNNPRSAAPPSKTLFIGNMSYQMSDRDLNDLFRQIRNVLDVRVAIDRRSGQPRGFAHADFVDVESATRAKETLEQKVVYGRQLRVDYSGQAKESGDRRERSDRGGDRYERGGERSDRGGDRYERGGDRRGGRGGDRDSY